MTTKAEDRCAAVAIGRNEGERLRRCIASLVGRFDPIVYVDSGSTDRSVEFVRDLGLEVVELDMSIPFSAGRARNAGFDRVREIEPKTDFVQFIDGDCELFPDFPRQAVAALRENTELAIVCGRRREREPEASIFNRLCDLEWNTPPGEVRACGGDFMARASAFREVDGFDAEFVAGEEPELCLRLRDRGWKIERLDIDMTRHDADIHRTGQWWRRSQRTGHAYAQTAWKHTGSTDPGIRRPLWSMAFWALLIPIIVLSTASVSKGWSGLLLLLYPIQILRVSRSPGLAGRPRREALAYGVSVVVGKFAQVHGLLRFLRDRFLRRPATLIEYKAPDRSRRSD